MCKLKAHVSLHGRNSLQPITLSNSTDIIAVWQTNRYINNHNHLSNMHAYSLRPAATVKMVANIHLDINVPGSHVQRELLI
jgi:hypothetical protein